MENQSSMDDRFLGRINQIIEENIDNENFTVEDLARNIGLSRSMLHRRLIKLTGKSATDIITKKRLIWAKELLDNNVATTSEIAYRVGFSSPSYFIKIFKKHFNVSPGEVRKNAQTKRYKERLREQSEPPVINRLQLFWLRTLVWGVLLAIIIAGGVIYYLSHDKKSPVRSLEGLISSDGKISIAVMPFRNMTNDTAWNVWQDAIKDNIITYLTNFPEELTVKQPESVNSLLQSRDMSNYASLTPSAAGAISRNLDANVFIFGSMSQSLSTIRINAQLVNSKTEEALKSFQIEGNTENEVFQMIDSLSGLVKDFLIMTVMRKEIITDFRPLISTMSSEAYRYYLYGNQNFYGGDISNAKDWYLKAIDIDTNFTEAMRMLSYSYKNLGMFEEAKEFCCRHYEKRDQMSVLEKFYAEAQYALFFETIYEHVKCWNSIIDYDDQMPVPYSNLADLYQRLQQYNQAISLCEKGLEIYDKWGIKPRWVVSYVQLAALYHMTGQYRKERKLLKKAEQDFPDNKSLLYRQAVLALTKNETNKANRYIDKYIVARKIDGASEAFIADTLAFMFEEADIPDKAEEYYRKALSLEPENPVRMNNLAWFLIDAECNVSEGLGIIDKALEFRPDDYNLLETKGWGLYKNAAYQEALEILQKSWDIRREKALYDHYAFLHLEEVRKAVAGQ